MRLAPGHARAAAIAFHAVCSAISAETGTILLSAAKGATATAVLSEGLTVAIASVKARVLNAAVAANQSVIAIVATVGVVRGTRAGLVLVPATIRTEISIWVIAPIRTVVRVFAGLVVSIRVKSAVGSIPGMVLTAGCSAAELVVTRARSATPGVVTVVA